MHAIIFVCRSMLFFQRSTQIRDRAIQQGEVQGICTKDEDDGNIVGRTIKEDSIQVETAFNILGPPQQVLGYLI